MILKFHLYLSTANSSPHIGIRFPKKKEKEEDKKVNH